MTDQNDSFIVDAHVHTFPTVEVGRQVLEEIKESEGVPYYCTGTIEEYETLMARYGIDWGVMVNFAPANQLKNTNFWTCAVVRPKKNKPSAHPRMIPLISVCPDMKGRTMLAEIEHKLKWGARGLKFHPVAQEFFPNDRRMWPIYARAEELGWPIVFHSGMNMRPRSIEYAEPKLFAEVLADFPRLTVILAHMGGGFWEQALGLAQRFPQVYFDTAIAICGVNTLLTLSDDEAVKMIRRMGAEWVLFGTDFPWIDPGPDIERIKGLPLSEEEKRAILGLNAARVFRLNGSD